MPTHLNSLKVPELLPNQLLSSKSFTMRRWLPLASLVMMATGVVTWQTVPTTGSGVTFAQPTVYCSPAQKVLTNTSA
jgi:hypothetical protein